MSAAPTATTGSGAAACPTLDQWKDRPAPTTLGGVPANTPEASALSQAVGAQGRGAFADIYGTQVTDFPAGRVALCVTDLARGRQLADAAKQAAPGIDLARLDIYPCRYTRQFLQAAMDDITKAGHDIAGSPIYIVSAASDASGIQVTTSQQGADSPALRQRLEEILGSTPVTLVAGAPVHAA
ncbi:hypothetical protein [Yinghuangia seranimata]|uniref:hypothetical protein n=1 Tax=Yinghuangia seranimata TaxID=408067 RepID=UPI00248B6775|nr:hypothetical protein [Yinghuangia seranimata]MDI2128325.1 hypothetical protein [Yinghuangia seranimata]